MADSHPFLFQGATGPAVEQCQRRLAALGFYQGPISGTYSPDTAGAAVKLQQQEKLAPVNGGFYQACWDALDRLEAKVKPPPPQTPGPAQAGASNAVPASAATGHPALRYGSQGQDVMALQQRLAKAGLNPGVADGVYGAYTSLAVSALQKEAALPATGAMDEATWSALERFEEDPPARRDGPDPSTTGPSGPLKVHPPTSARLKNPAWDSLVYRDGANAVLCCDAPDLEGHSVTFFVQRSTDRLQWTDLKQVQARVAGGRARASVPVQSQRGQRVHLRFRVDLGVGASPQEPACLG